MEDAATARMEEIFWPRGPRRDIWAILDGARDRRVYSFLLNSYLNYSCLYAGPLAPELEIAAPYLVQLELGDRYSRELLEAARGRHWGVYLRCDAGMERLRRHLRGFLRVEDYRGRRLVFRYYDPRVLRVYLPTCITEELRTVFGPVERFWTEAESPDRLLEFRLEGGKLGQRSLPLAGGEAAGA